MEAGFTQSELAEMVGNCKDNISRLERNKFKNPTSLLFMTNKSIFKSFDCYLQLYLKGTARNLRAVPRAFYQSDVIIIIQWLYISDHWKLVLLLSSEQTVSGYHVCIHL